MIEEAIERNKALVNIQINNKYLFEEDTQAIQLGIEALERLKELRQLAKRNTLVDWRKAIRDLLPSEGEK